MGIIFPIVLLLVVLAGAIRRAGATTRGAEREALLSHAETSRGLLPNEAPRDSLPAVVANNKPQQVRMPLSTQDLLDKVATNGLLVTLSPERIREIRSDRGTLEPRVDMIAPSLPSYEPEGAMPPALIVEEDTPAWVRQHEIDLV